MIRRSSRSHDLENSRRRIGIVIPNWIGDAVMATPALRALREAHGTDAMLVGVMKPLIADVLAGTDWLDENVLYDRRSRNPQFKMRSVADRLRKLRLDQILLLTNSFSSGLLAWRSEARQRIGSARYGRSLLLTDALPLARANGKVVPYSPVSHYLQIAEHSFFLSPRGERGQCSDLPRQVELGLTSTDRENVDRVWRQFGFDSGGPVVVFNNGGGYGAAKRWPTEHFVALARRVVDRTDASVLMVCGPAERADAAEFERQADHPRIRSLANVDPDIGLTKACVQRSAAVVSTDSGVRHFAAGFGKPSVALFGPMNPAASENYHATETRLQLELACSPCGKRVCPLGHHQCMRDLSVTTVFDALTGQLQIAVHDSAA